MRRIKLLLLFVVYILSNGHLKAWDEVSHGYMTKMIIDEIENPKLKKLLQNHRDAFIYGSWFTDTYQYTDQRIEKLNPHILQIHTQAFLPYLQKTEVRQQENYDELVAFFLGSLAHTAEDFWLDFILYSYPKEERGDLMTGDTYNGVINIKHHEYLTLDVKQSLLMNDLFKIYSEAGLLKEGYNQKTAFASMLNSWSNKQFLMLRSLKLLSFLSSDQLVNKSPWTAANMMDASGGLKDCTQKAAQLVEAYWKRIDNKAVDGIIAANYIWIDNSLALLTSFPINAEKIPRENSFVINQKGDTIYGRMDQMKYNGSNLNKTNVVIKFIPETSFIENEAYTFHLASGAYGDRTELSLEREFIYSFKVVIDHTMINTFAESKPFLSTMRLGLFFFILSLGMGGVCIGFSGVLSFLWNSKNRNANISLGYIFLKRISEVLGLVMIILGVYLLISQAWIVLLNV